MMKPRLLPAVITVAVMLLGLKSIALLTNGYHIIEVVAGLAAKESTTQTAAPKIGDQPSKQMTDQQPVQEQSSNKPKKTNVSDKNPDKDKADERNQPKSKSVPKIISHGQEHELEAVAFSKTEKALLVRLAKRSHELDQREKKLGLRETVVTAVEKKVEGRINELSRLLARLLEARDKITKRHRQQIIATIEIYETMKPKKAAKIFNLLASPVLSVVAGKMKTNNLSKIMAQMNPEKATALTNLLVIQRNLIQDQIDAKKAKLRLPKIIGK